MTKKELIYSMTSNDATLTIKAAGNALDAFTESVNKAMARGEKVSISGFGTFSVIRRKARTGRNPKTGDEIKIPVRHYSRFKAGCDLREAAKACIVK
ncbi:MAG: HU family DNA-binding protein [bacterium]